MYTWLLFDADGTLFDYEIAERKALTATFAQYKLRFNDVALLAYQRINHQLWVDFEAGLVTPDFIKTARFQRLFEALALSESPEAHEFGDAYLDNLGYCSDFITGATELLEAVKKTHHLALITNGLSKVQHSRLSLSGLDSLFEAIIISEEVGIAKPDPGIFDAAFKAMGNPRKADVLIIGDSLTSDMRGGHDYGIDTCWYNPGGAAASDSFETTYVVKRLYEVLPIVHCSQQA